MSYMDRKNIIEGFLDLFKKLPKDVRKLKLNTFEKHLYKTDSEFKKSVDDMIKSAKNIDKLIKKGKKK
jgi:hypothetical protein